MALVLRERASPNFDARARAIELVILHYTGMADAETALARLTDPAPIAGRYTGPWQPADIDPNTQLGRASAHYVVDEAGLVYRLVDEEQRAWHAGLSSWNGEADVNSRSIGIEIVNGGHDYGLPDFPDAQIDAVIALLKDILARRKLSPRAVLAHSDIAPARKQDPGENFPWERLAKAGVARAIDYVAMQASSKPDPALIQDQLKTIGYGVEQTGAFDEQTSLALAAFQRRFRRSRVSGEPDEETQALLAALAR